MNYAWKQSETDEVFSYDCTKGTAEENTLQRNSSILDKENGYSSRPQQTAEALVGFFELVNSICILHYMEQLDALFSYMDNGRNLEAPCTAFAFH